MSKSLHLNDINWQVSYLGEQALLLEIRTNNDADILHLIHSIVLQIEKADIEGLVDVVPAYDSIAFMYDRLIEDLDAERQIIGKAITSSESSITTPEKYKVPVCYELGLDWEEMENQTGLEKEEIINLHTKEEYTVAMMGFIPGFLYLNGLNKQISCPRKENPRSEIPAGAVGIGGDQAGIYSLKSPGGWQIIGRTPLSFFDADAIPPSKVEPGDKIVFIRIDEDEFESMGKEGSV